MRIINCSYPSGVLFEFVGYCLNWLTINKEIIIISIKLNKNKISSNRFFSILQYTHVITFRYPDELYTL